MQFAIILWNATTRPKYHVRLKFKWFLFIRKTSYNAMPLHNKTTCVIFYAIRWPWVWSYFSFYYFFYEISLYALSLSYMYKRLTSKWPFYLSISIILHNNITLIREIHIFGTWGFLTTTQGDKQSHVTLYFIFSEYKCGAIFLTRFSIIHNIFIMLSAGRMICVIKHKFSHAYCDSCFIKIFQYVSS